MRNSSCLRGSDHFGDGVKLGVNSSFYRGSGHVLPACYGFRRPNVTFERELRRPQRSGHVTCTVRL